MDRQTVYFGSLARETDLLQAQQNTMVALAKLSAAALGTNTVVNGFTCTPTSTASLNVIVTPGEIYQIEDLEATPWSSLPADTTDTILKQGIVLEPQTLPIVPPSTFGFSQVYLIQVQYEDQDTGLVVLPYFNSANPSSPFSGPGNSGSVQNTVRKGFALVQAKAGTAVSTGSQVAPTPDAGWVGLFLVTVANGASTITSGNITPYPDAPFIPVTLPGVPGGVLNGSWVFTEDTGTANTYVASIAVPGFQPASLVAGMEVRVKIATTNTGASTFNLNNLGAHPITRSNLSAVVAGDLAAGQVVKLIFDGSNWQVANYQGIGTGTTNNIVNNNTTITGLPFATDSGTTNNLVGSFTPAVTAATLVAGLQVEVKVANANSGPTTLNPNTLGAKNVVFPNGNALTANTLKPGMMAVMVYDGTNFQLLSSNDASSPSKQFFAEGAGQTFVTGTVDQITCFNNVGANTTSNSTWDGANLTIGPGDDGLWSFSVFGYWGQVIFYQCQTFIVVKRNGVIIGSQGGVVATGMENTPVGAAASGTVFQPVQVGDVVSFWGSIGGPSGTYTLGQSPADAITNGQMPFPSVNAFRFFGLH